MWFLQIPKKWPTRKPFGLDVGPHPTLAAWSPTVYPSWKALCFNGWRATESGEMTFTVCHGSHATMLFSERCLPSISIRAIEKPWQTVSHNQMVFTVTLIISCLPWKKHRDSSHFSGTLRFMDPFMDFALGCLIRSSTESIDRLVKIHGSTYGFPIKYRESSICNPKMAPFLIIIYGYNQVMNLMSMWVII